MSILLLNISKGFPSMLFRLKGLVILSLQLEVYYTKILIFELTFELSIMNMITSPFLA